MLTICKTKKKIEKETNFHIKMKFVIKAAAREIQSGFFL